MIHEVEYERSQIMNNGFIKWFDHLINAYVYCIFLLMSSHVHRVEIHIDSDSKLSQGYFLASEKGGIWFFFLTLAGFSLDPVYGPFSGYLYEVIPSCWIGTRVVSSW